MMQEIPTELPSMVLRLLREEDADEERPFAIAPVSRKRAYCARPNGFMDHFVDLTISGLLKSEWKT